MEENQIDPQISVYFQELFLEENWEKLSKLCMKYGALIKVYQQKNQPMAPSLLAADLGLTVPEYTQLVQYFNEQYAEDVQAQVEEEKQRGEAINWESYFD